MMENLRVPNDTDVRTQRPLCRPCEATQERMMPRVETADALITHSTRYAIALHCSASPAEPAIVAGMGMDRVADRIREIAREHRIPSVEDPLLAEALYHQATLDEPVPVRLCEAVRRVTAYLEQLRRRRPTRYFPLRRAPVR